jgi:hypothetical protein
MSKIDAPEIAHAIAPDPEVRDHLPALFVGRFEQEPTWARSRIDAARSV